MHLLSDDVCFGRKGFAAGDARAGADAVRDVGGDGVLRNGIRRARELGAGTFGAHVLGFRVSFYG